MTGLICHLPLCATPVSTQILIRNHTSYTTTSTRTVISSQFEHKNIIEIQNTLDILNTDDINSCVTPPKQNISVQVKSTPPRLTPLIDTVPLAPVELPKITELYPGWYLYVLHPLVHKY